MSVWNHFLSVLYHLSPPDWINLGVAAGTVTIAVYTRKAVHDSKVSIQAATRSALAAEQNAERMKDALMPYLDLSITNATSFMINDKDELKTKDLSANLFITNNGTGPARIGLFTNRADVRYENGLDWTLCGLCREVDLKE